MRKLALLMLLVPAGCLAQRVNFECALGGNTVTTLGSVSSTFVRKSYPNATATVYLTGTQTKATLTNTSSGSGNINPFTCDSTGHGFFEAIPGDYDVTISPAGISPFTLGNIQLGLPTTVQVYNVKSQPYGAKGDGSTDDTAAINAAFADAKAAHGTLFFPPGTYAHASSLNWTGVADLRIEGGGRGCSSNSGVAGCSVDLLYTGAALTGTCPVEMVNDSWIDVQHIGFSSTNSVACQILLGSSTSAESFHLRFTNIDTASGSIASVANFGGESLTFDGDFTLNCANGTRCLLMSSNGGSGFGISSQFGYTFGSRSTTMFSFIAGNFDQQGGTGNINVELDGTGTGITDLQFIGDFQQVNAGSYAFKIDGVVQALGIHGARLECDIASGPNSYFFNFNSARLDGSQVTEFNPSSLGAPLLFSTGSAEIDGLIATGTNLNTVTDTGNVNNLWLDSYAVPTITITGSLTGVVKSETGTPVVSATAGLNITLNNLRNVVWDQQVNSGSSTFTLPGTGFQSALFKATYISAGCQFMYSEGFGAGAGSFAQVSTVTSAVGDSASQTLTCPVAGSSTSAPSIVATFTNTGGAFIVQQF